MKRWKKVLALTMVSTLLFTQSAYAEKIPYVGTQQEVKEQYEETAKKAGSLAKTLCETYGVQSVQYALIDQGKIVLANHAGAYSRTENRLLKNGNMYGIGSISKMYVTASIMKLYDEGKIDLDAPVTKYIKEFKMADSRYKKITVRMLLNHSSGLMGSTFKNSFTFDTYNKNVKTELLDELKTQRLKAEPGAFSVYCNDGFTLAEILVERVSKQDFSEYLQQNFFDELGMNNTKTPAQSFPTSKLAKTYVGNDTTALPKEVLSIIGAGGIYSSAADVCRMATVFMEQNSMLSKQAKEEMESMQYKNGLWPEVEDGLFAYGLGWDNVSVYPFHKYGIKALSKAGDTSFYHGSLITLPEENMAVAVLSSGGASSYDQVMGQEILLTALKEKGIIKQIEPSETLKAPVKATIPEQEMENAGYYAGLLMYQVEMEKEGTLTLSYVANKEMPSIQLIYTTDGDFATQDGSVRIKFVKEKNGKTYMLQSQCATLPALGQVKDAQYVAEKIEENPVSDQVWNTWKERDGKKYYLVDEPYNALSYFGSAVAQIEITEELRGYIATNMIQDEVLAQGMIQIPGMAGRDMSDLRFYKKGNAEYMEYDERNYIREDFLKQLPTKNNSLITIDKTGETKWYLADSVAGKTVTVQIPKNASVVLYDKDNNVLDYSIVTKNNTMELKKGDKIAFVGQPGSKFKLTYAKTK